MTDHQNDAIEKRDPPKEQPGTGHKEDALAHWTGSLLDRGDTIIYAIVGACFFLGGFFALGYSFWNLAPIFWTIPL